MAILFLSNEIQIMKYYQWKKSAIAFILNESNYTQEDQYWISNDIDTIASVHLLGNEDCKLGITFEIPDDKLSTLNESIALYKHETPLARILGFTYFYGYKFWTAEDVLIPRFDSETLVFEVFQALVQTLEEKASDSIVVLELCLGSACLSVALQYLFREKYGETKRLTIFASEFSESAIQLAKKNIHYHNMDDCILPQQADLWPSEIPYQSIDLVFSNPPYLSQAEFDQSDLANFEPELAFVSGEDGLNLIGRMIDEAHLYFSEEFTLYLEHGRNQGKAIENLLSTKENWKHLALIHDLANRPRVSVIKFIGD